MARSYGSSHKNASDDWDADPAPPRRRRPSNRPYSLILPGLCAVVFVTSLTVELLSAETPKPKVTKPTTVAAASKGDKAGKGTDTPAAAAQPAEPTPTPPEPKPEPPKPVEQPKPKPKPTPEPEMPAETPKPTPKPTPEPEKPAEPKKPEPKKTEPAKDAAVTFAKVSAVFQNKCVMCHGGGMTKNGLDMKTVASITRGGNGGPGLKPGEPERSYIYEVIKDGSMPPPGRPSLTEDEKKLIHDWIAAGAK